MWSVFSTGASVASQMETVLLNSVHTGTARVEFPTWVKRGEIRALEKNKLKEYSWQIQRSAVLLAFSLNCALKSIYWYFILYSF